ncbi:MAG: glycosyltransferase family 2 protein [Polaromonas sp.]
MTEALIAAPVSVSVVLPCYRCMRTLERAVASVAAQTALPLEVILVDDGSSDGTRELLMALRERHAPGWIKLVLLDKNVGAASARNAGWDQAAGQFIAFLDADDSWHPRKLELQYAFMASHPHVAVSGHGHVQVQCVPEPPSLGAPAFQRLPAFYVLMKNPFITPSFMVRRELPLRFLSGRRHMEDHLFLMQVKAVGGRIAKSNLPLAFIYKNIFGDSGLSADLWVMQRSELENYRLLCEQGQISLLAFSFFRLYSWLKFFRRVMIVKCRRLTHRAHETV